MPRIATYEAKDLKLTPSDKGYSAAEMAARRIGPFYSQAGEAAAKVGRLQEQELDLEGKEITSFLRFQGLSEASGGGGVKYGGGLKGMKEMAAGGNEPNYAALNEMANAAPGMSKLARNLVNNPQAGMPKGGPVSDTENGVSVLRGGADKDQSDVENGVTVLRGSSKLAVNGGTPDPTEQLLGMPNQPPSSTAAKIYQPGNNMQPRGDDTKAGGYGQTDMSPYAEGLQAGGDPRYVTGAVITGDVNNGDTLGPAGTIPGGKNIRNPWPNASATDQVAAPVNDNSGINQDDAPPLWMNLGDGM